MKFDIGDVIRRYSAPKGPSDFAYEITNIYQTKYGYRYVLRHLATTVEYHCASIPIDYDYCLILRPEDKPLPQDLSRT